MSLSGVILLVSGITVGLGALIWSLVWLVGKGQETLVPATQKKQATFRSLLWPRFMEASDAELTANLFAPTHDPQEFSLTLASDNLSINEEAPDYEDLGDVFFGGIEIE